MTLKHNDLKQGIFTSPQSGDVEFKRYIVENVEDLEKFRERFPKIKLFNMYNNLLKSIYEGYIILLTDEHIMTGLPTYCFESGKDNTHPGSIHRVKILN